MSKNKIINVQGQEISIIQISDNDFISLTDMAKSQDEGIIISKWLTNKNTILFLGAWESMNNPDFNYTEFGIIKNEAGVNRFVMSVKNWMDRTNAKGIIAKAGRYGSGTYAHKDIAFEFGTWISPEFKLYLIKEFQRLKEIESNVYNLEWNFKRVLSKANYNLHTSAIKEYIIPQKNVEKDKEWIIYADEADLLNMSLFKCTAKYWRENNPTLALKGMNLRDVASINELAVLSNLESLNSILIKNNVDKATRFKELKKIAEQQLTALNQVDFIKSYKHTSENTYPKIQDEVKSENNNIDYKGSFGDAIRTIAKAGKPKISN